MTVHEEVSPELGPVPTGFNWGAFVFSGVFLLAYQRVGTFFLLVLIHILLRFLGTVGVLVSLFFGLVTSIYFGVEAKQIAWDTDRFKTYAELERSMRRWNIAALVFVVLLGGLYFATRG
jgi:hypothetical protein